MSDINIYSLELAVFKQLCAYCVAKMYGHVTAILKTQKTYISLTVSQKNKLFFVTLNYKQTVNVV